MTHTPPTPPSRRKRDPGGTRRRLVRSALELFTTVGFHASTTQHIARKAGVAEGTIYRHFASKEVLLNEIFRAAIDTFTTALSTEVTASVSRMLDRVARDWIIIAAGEPGLVRLVFVNPPHRLLDKRSRSAYRDFRASVERLIAAGKANGQIKAGSAELWTDVWIQNITLALQKVASERWGVGDEATSLVIDSAWDALAARAPDSGAPSNNDSPTYS